MERIGIFGGTFNPVHIEHMEVVRHAIEELKLDRLIVMPTFIAPHKTDIPLPAQDRINMLKIAFKDFDKVEVSDFEILNGGKSYTYLTVEHFKKTLNAHVFFICGGDMLTNFKTWRYPERILAACDLAAFGREDFFTDYSAEKALFLERFNKSFIQLKYIGKNFSSTKIRIYSAFNLPLENLVPKGVEEYIKQNNLYEGDFYTKFICANLPLKRVLHTANVVIAALRKAKELGLDKGKVMLAATLHDCAKYMDYKAAKGFVLPEGVPEPVIHSFLGAFIAYHTSGKANMTTLGKLIFVADMVEEGRNYDGVEYLRALYEKEDFEFCFKECLREEMLHLQNKGQPIYKETINAFNYYCK